MSWLTEWISFSKTKILKNGNNRNKGKIVSESLGSNFRRTFEVKELDRWYSCHHRLDFFNTECC